MKRSYWPVIGLCLVLLGNIFVTQHAVWQFSYENYVETVIFAALNVILLPVALFIYNKAKRSDEW